MTEEPAGTDTVERDMWAIDEIPEVLREQLMAMATPAHLAQYVTKRMPPDAQWRPFQHLLHINNRIIDAVTDEQQRFLNVAVSVRHGKSELISRYLPVWYLGMFPDRQVIIVSYNESKAAEWGEFCRNVMEIHGPELFGIEVDSRNASKTNWSIKGRRGGLRAVGVGGSLTGIGGDLIIIDDPIKNREEADSEAARKAMFSWYGSTLRTRLMPKGTLILTMARWHTDDLTGKIEEKSAKGGDQWEYIRLPALAEAPKDCEDFELWEDELGRHDGDALWPEIWSKEMLEQIRDSIDAADWESLYQQNPTPAEGGMFKVDQWRTYPSVNRATLRECRCWDLAATEGGGDWTVGVRMGFDPQGRVFITDVQRVQLNEAGVKKLVFNTGVMDGRSIPVRIEQERAGAGKAEIGAYKRLMRGWDIDGVKPEGTKEQRARNYASTQQDGEVYLVDEGDAWRTTLIEEHRVFPKGRHDDIVDAAAGAFEFLAAGGTSTLIAEEILEVPLELMWKNRMSIS